jgi:O-antigen/teichoic acid export membrane protein
VAGVSRSPAGAMMFTAIAAIGALALLLMHFRKVFAPARGESPDYTAWRQWFAVSLPLLIIGVTQELLNQLEVILLGWLADARSAGLFSAASRLVSLMPFALSALSMVSGPMIVSAYRRRDFAEVNRISVLAARLALAFAAVAGFVLVVAGRFLLGIFGSEFVQGYSALLILLIGSTVNAFTGVVVYLLTLTGREIDALVIFVGSLALSLLLNLILIPHLGVVGAAISSTSALCAWNVAMAVYVRRVLGVDATAVGRQPRSLLL